MLDSQQLQQLVFKILRSDLSRSELNLYLRYSASFAQAYLISRRSQGRLSQEYQQADDQKINHLAIDCIAELFERDADNNLVKLIQYYEPLQNQINADADEALFMTRRLVVAHTKQSLARAFQQNDPSGARIYRNLALVPKRDTGIHLVKYGDEDYFYLWDETGEPAFPDDFNPAKQEIDWDSALHMLEYCRKNQDALPGIVRSFLAELQYEDDYRHFIYRRNLYKLLKHIMGLKILSFDAEYAIPTAVNQQHLELSQADQIVFTDRIKPFYRHEINMRYVAKSKLSNHEAEVYVAILDQYFEDLLMDGYAGKLPEYKAGSGFSDMQPEIWKIHRGRLEYVIKLIREKLKTQYSRDFPNLERMRIES